MSKQISVQKIAETIENIKINLRDCPDGLDDFLNFFLSYLPSKKISRSGFIQRYNRAYDDLRRGRRGRQKIEHDLVGAPGLVLFNIYSSRDNVVRLFFKES